MESKNSNKRKAIVQVCPVTCKTKKFESISAVTAYGFSAGHVCNCCNNYKPSRFHNMYTRTHKGFKWLYMEDFEKMGSNELIAFAKARVKDTTPKKVIQINTETKEVIQIFNTVSEVRKQGFDDGQVSRCCNNKAKSHKGFKWMFLDDFNELLNSLTTGFYKLTW